MLTTLNAVPCHLPQELFEEHNGTEGFFEKVIAGMKEGNQPIELSRSQVSRQLKTHKLERKRPENDDGGKPRRKKKEKLKGFVATSDEESEGAATDTGAAAHHSYASPRHHPTIAPLAAV